MLTEQTPFSVAATTTFPRALSPVVYVISTDFLLVIPLRSVCRYCVGITSGDHEQTRAQTIESGRTNYNYNRRAARYPPKLPASRLAVR
jgi:hypothetical protein